MPISASLSVTVIKGLYYLMMPQYCYNVGLSNQSCVASDSSVNGNTYNIPQTCGSGVSFQFQALDENGNAIAGLSISLHDESTGVIRTATTNGSGYVTFSFNTGCHAFNVGYTLTYKVYAQYQASGYSSPTINVNVD